MIKVLIFVAFLLLGQRANGAYNRCLWYRKPLTRGFCLNPPVEKVDFDRYLGKWYQVYANPEALVFSATGCITANYSALADGSVRVLNCQYSRGRGSRATCVDGRATKTGKPGRLTVSFGRSPPGPYSVAALLGEAEWGYYAAAVYSCTVRNGEFREAWFIIARSPYLPRRTLRRLARKLHCKGYDLSRTRFISTKHGRGCKYFFGLEGFTSVAPSGGRPRNLS